jgi:hypothetical protein
MKQFLMLLLLIITFTFLACNSSKELSRDKAELMLKEYDFKYEKGAIPTRFYKEFHMSDPGSNPKYAQDAQDTLNYWIEDKKTNLKELKDHNFITYKIQVNNRNVKGSLYKRVNILIQATSKLKPLILANKDNKIIVIDCTKKFDKITSIKKISENESIVEFIVAARQSDVSPYLETTTPGEINRSAIFKRSDDGWRLMKVN